LKPILLDDAFDAPSADGEACLAELLSDDVGRGIEIQEAVTDDLSFEFLGADIVGLRSSLLAREGLGSVFSKYFKQLIISLSSESQLLSGQSRSDPFAFSFDEHDQSRGDEVMGRDHQFAGRPDDVALGDFEFHGGDLW
jgi:hypothetical protein